MAFSMGTDGPEAVQAPDIIAAAPAELAIITPTFNESENVELLISTLDRALCGICWELIFVDDDSTDGTSGKVREIAQRDARIRIVHRIGRRGLSSACVEGIMSTAAPFVAVIDADLQHDESILPRMLKELRAGQTDIVVGSRYTEGGSVGEWSRARILASRIATRMAYRLTRTQLTDPMSGFFMLRRDVFESSLRRLSTVGFKILLDIVASAPSPPRVREIPYTFRLRTHGDSKLDSLVLWEYVQLILDKTFGHLIPIRFLSFALVGTFGVAVHFAVLAFVFKILGASFAVAQTVASIVAISNNFFLNNVLTYRDQRLKGRALLTGWLTFNMVCAFGAAANVGVADWLFVHDTFWAASAIAGVFVSVVWNYAMSSLFTWRQKS